MDKEVNKNIADLAMMVANGFSGMDKRITESENRQMEQLETIVNRLETLDTAVFNLDGKVKDMSSTLKRVEESIEPLLTGYRIMQKEIGELSLRIDKLEEKTAMYK